MCLEELRIASSGRLPNQGSGPAGACVDVLRKMGESGRGQTTRSPLRRRPLNVPCYSGAEAPPKHPHCQRTVRHVPVPDSESFSGQGQHAVNGCPSFINHDGMLPRHHSDPSTELNIQWSTHDEAATWHSNQALQRTTTSRPELGSAWQRPVLGHDSRPVTRGGEPVAMPLLSIPL